MKCDECLKWLASWTKKEVDTGMCPECREAALRSGIDSETRQVGPRDRDSVPRAPRVPAGRPAGPVVGKALRTEEKGMA